MKVSAAQLDVLHRLCKRMSYLDHLNMGVGGVEWYEIGLGSTQRTLAALERKGLVETFHRREPHRRLPGPGCSSHHPGGYTLYRLTPAGTAFIFDRIYKEEAEKTLAKRVADRIRMFALSHKHLKATPEQREVAKVLREES